MREQHPELEAFVRESNRIEGIVREPKPMELVAHITLLSEDVLTVSAIEAFVSEVAGAKLRDRFGMNVRVGSHYPPPGDPDIRDELAQLLEAINDGHVSAHDAHVAYEHLHPFMDGNGRSGRAIWAWQMQLNGHNPFVLPFLHRFYYQTLDAALRKQGEGR